MPKIYSQRNRKKKERDVKREFQIRNTKTKIGWSRKKKE